MQLLILGYHYIEDENIYCAGIYPTSPERFSKHLDIIGKNYTFISEMDLVDAIRGKKILPDRSCLLTFDDGLSSHYTAALPILKERSLPAVFFIPTSHFFGDAYTTHKVHYLLSLIKAKELLATLEHRYEMQYEKAFDWEAVDEKKMKKCYPFDDVYASRFKYLINYHLSVELSEKFIHQLFEQYYDGTEKDFCDRFYMSKQQVKEILENPLLSVGFHTHTHVNIPRSTKEVIEADMQSHVGFFQSELGIKETKGIAYPWGIFSEEDYKNKLKDILISMNVAYGITTNHGINRDLDTSHLLARMDGNRYPDTLIDN